MALKNIIGKTAYGLLFCALLPALLIWWSHETRDIISLPVPGNIFLTYTFIIFGFLMIMQSMLNLFVHGKGLPMNAFPPKHYVQKGFYKYFNHPIYIGVCLVIISAAIYTQSSSLFWLVTPVFILSCLALVYGYENESIKHLFALKELRTSWSLPADTADTPASAERISVLFKLFIPWLLIYELRVLMGEAEQSMDIRFDFEKTLPVYEFTEFFYVLIYPLIILFPFLVKTKTSLRSFLVEAYLVCFIGFFLLFLLPVISPFREFNPVTILGKLLLFERDADSYATAFPSFHVLWALVGYNAYASNYPKLKWIWLLLFVSIIISCFTTGMHAIADISASIIIYAGVFYRKKIWAYISTFSGRMANSWKEWHIGNFRIINHSIWPGLACFTGIIISAMILQNTAIPVIACLSSILAAGLWGQFVEGSPKLLRPFGYYGSIVGGVISVCILSVIYSVSLINLFAAFAVAAPWVQAIGRLRCWIQGCCHGSVTDEIAGIKYFHPKSRVCKISELRGKPLHNTQLYSIISNIICGLILIRLLWSQQSPALIAGLYFILNGLSRFVEESYRGEAQTKLFYGLRFYQWLAILSIVTGAIVTCINARTPLAPEFKTDYSMLLAATACGLFAAFAMGMDFPKSNVRFSRLAD